MTGRPERIRRLEEIGLATWPALEHHTDGSWVFRTARGVTNRSNSVSPLGQPDGTLLAALRDAERWYAALGLPCRFRLTELAPTELEMTLGARGYRRENAVDVMTRRIEDASEPGDVRIGVVIKCENGYFASGNKLEISRTDPKDALGDALDYLIQNAYPKMSFIRHLRLYPIGRI